MVELSRRSFVMLSSAAVAACSMPFSSEKADVVIIGAGLSGLHSAYLLRRAGLKVVVLEGGDKVGGRCRTLDLADGHLDVGASQIGRDYARILDACVRYNMQLIPEDRDLLDFATHFQGQWLRTEEWADSPLNRTVGDERAVPPMLMGRHIASQANPFEGPTDWLDPKFAEYDISLLDLMRRNGNSEQAIELARFTVPGIALDRTSLLRMWQEETRSKIGAQFDGQMAEQATEVKHPFGEINVLNEDGGLARISNIVGGTSRLPEAMAADLGDAVRLNKKVAQISMTGSGATVTCEDGSSISAGFVLSCLPFSMLRHVDIEGAGGEVNRKAIDNMPYANTARMYLTLDEPFWENDGLPASFSSDGPMGMFWAIDNTRSGGAHRAMIVLVGEAAGAIAEQPREQAERFILDEMVKLRPASEGKMRMLTYKDWQRDPLQQGCSFSFDAGQVNEFGRDMLQPWGRLHFAGEHTRRTDYGMEAAMESAERAAQEIIQAAS